MIPALLTAPDFRRWPNFTVAEMSCKHTGECRMDPGLMDRLQRLRIAWGRPMTITSAFRAASHPVEARKARPGSHAMGRAVDIAVTGGDAFALVRLAYEEGFTGIGIAKTFVHLDDVTPRATHIVRPMLWVY